MCAAHHIIHFQVAKLCFLFVFVRQQGIVMLPDQMEGKRLLIYLLCTTHRSVCALSFSVRTITSVK